MRILLDKNKWKKIQNAIQELIQKLVWFLGIEKIVKLQQTSKRTRKCPIELAEKILTL